MTKDDLVAHIRARAAMLEAFFVSMDAPDEAILEAGRQSTELENIADKIECYSDSHHID